MITPEDERKIEELIAEKLDIVSAFRDLPDADRESIANDISGFLYNRQMALRKPENTYTPRWTQDMADVNVDDAGVFKGHAGSTLPRWIDVVSGASWLDADDTQILHISGGAGVVPYDYVVSDVYTGTEGRAFTDSVGHTFRIYVALSGAMTDLATRFAGGIGTVLIEGNAGLDAFVLPTGTTEAHIYGIKLPEGQAQATDVPPATGASSIVAGSGPMFVGGSGWTIKFYDLLLLTDTGAGAEQGIWDSSGGNGPTSFTLTDCSFRVGWLASVLAGQTLAPYFRLSRCKGYMDAFYSSVSTDGATFSLYADNSTCTVERLADGSGGATFTNGQFGTFFWRNSSLYIAAETGHVISMQSEADSHRYWRFENSVIDWHPASGGHTLFTCTTLEMANSATYPTVPKQTISWVFDSLRFRVTNSNMNFCDFDAGGAVSVRNVNIIISDIEAVITQDNPGSTQAGPLITIGANLATCTRVGDVLAPNWSSVLSVPSSSGPPLVTIPTLDEVLTAGNDAGTQDIINLGAAYGTLAGAITQAARAVLAAGWAYIEAGNDGTFTQAGFYASAGDGADGKAGILTDGSDGAAGEVLTADGAGTATWEAAGAGSLTDHTHAATGSGATGGGSRTRPLSRGTQPVAKTIAAGLLTLSSPGESHIILTGEGAADDVLTDITAGADGDELVLEWDGATAIRVDSSAGSAGTLVQLDGGQFWVTLGNPSFSGGKVGHLTLRYSLLQGAWIGQSAFNTIVGIDHPTDYFTGLDVQSSQVLFFVQGNAVSKYTVGREVLSALLGLESATVTLAAGLVVTTAVDKRSVLEIVPQSGTVDTLAGVAFDTTPNPGDIIFIRPSSPTDTFIVSHNDVVEGTDGVRIFTLSAGNITLTGDRALIMCIWTQALDGGLGGWQELFNTVTSTKSVVGSVFSPDSDTATPQMLVGPMLQGGRITAVHAKTGHNLTCGATSWIGDVHKIAAADKNTDGAGTTIFSTKPTIANTEMYDGDAVVSVTTFAVGDWFAFYSDQHGSGLAEVVMTMEVIYS